MKNTDVDLVIRQATQDEDKTQEILDKFFRYNEYLEIKIDTEKMTAEVAPKY